MIWLFPYHIPYQQKTKQKQKKSCLPAFKNFPMLGETNNQFYMALSCDLQRNLRTVGLNFQTYIEYYMQYFHNPVEGILSKVSWSFHKEITNYDFTPVILRGDRKWKRNMSASKSLTLLSWISRHKHRLKNKTYHTVWTVPNPIENDRKRHIR